MTVHIRDKPIARAYHKGRVTYPAPVKKGLLYWLDFKGRTNNDAKKGTVADLSGNGKDGTLGGFAYGKGSGYLNNELKFDGIDDYVSVIPNNTPVAYPAFTYEISFILNAISMATTYQNILYLDSPTYFMIRASTNSAFFSFSSSTMGQVTMAADIPLQVGKQYNFQVVYDGTTVTVYNDGVAVGSRPLTGLISFGAVNYLGRYNGQTYFDGRMRYFRVYTRALSAQELAQNLAVEKVRWSPMPTQKGLQLWYDFHNKFNSDGSRSLIKDLSQSFNEGILTNFAFSEGSGYLRKALRFDGVDDLVTSKEKINFTTQISMEVVCSVDQFNAWMSPLSTMRHSAPSSGISLILYSQNRVYIAVGTGETSSYTYRIVNVEGLIVGKKNHYLVTYDGTKIEFFMNGTSLLVWTISFPLIPEHVIIGKWALSYGGYVYAGLIQSARIYNRALTPIEIQHNYQVEKARWKL